MRRRVSPSSVVPVVTAPAAARRGSRLPPAGGEVLLDNRARDTSPAGNVDLVLAGPLTQLDQVIPAARLRRLRLTTGACPCAARLGGVLHKRSQRLGQLVQVP